MKQKLVTALVIIVCFIFQCTIFKGLALASISPNLLLIFTTSMGFMRGEREGLVIGFFCGLLMDIFFGSLLGFYALLYMFLGYGSGLFHMIFYDEDIKLPMIWIALSELVYGLSIYFFLFLMRSRFEFGYYFIHIILPELIYTVALTIVLYRPIQKLNSLLEYLKGDTIRDYHTTSAMVGQAENQTEEL
ncbi:MAG: rod shape-determining protein MreD [Lachnospiraceae bacterium]|jgi:rod shape-determining protein MreD|nr:rod shape-determining protein MreD [Lachnospiraceae bacterium]MCI9306995.1 rod shape-determining protein MreD [Lachnospiraceae bacterium]